MKKILAWLDKQRTWIFGSLDTDETRKTISKRKVAAFLSLLILWYLTHKYAQSASKTGNWEQLPSVLMIVASYSLLALGLITAEQMIKLRLSIKSKEIEKEEKKMEHEEYMSKVPAGGEPQNPMGFPHNDNAHE